MLEGASAGEEKRTLYSLLRQMTLDSYSLSEFFSLLLYKSVRVCNVWSSRQNL